MGWKTIVMIMKYCVLWNIAAEIEMSFPHYNKFVYWRLYMHTLFCLWQGLFVHILGTRQLHGKVVK